MTTTQRRLAIGAIVSVMAIVIILLLVSIFTDYGLNFKNDKTEVAVSNKAEPLLNRLERTIERIERKQLEVKNDKQAYVQSKKTKAYVDSLNDIHWTLNSIKENAKPLVEYLTNKELAGDELKEVEDGIFKFIELQSETDSLIGAADLLYHNFHQYQIAEKDQTIEEQAKEIKKYKRLAQKYRTMYADLNTKLEKANAMIDSLESAINNTVITPKTSTEPEAMHSSGQTDSLKLELEEQKQLAEALKDSVNRFPQFEIIRFSANPYKAKNFKISNHWNLRHIEKYGFFAEIQAENFKHPHDTLQLKIIVDVPVNKDEYKTFETELTYNFKTNTHNKLEFFPENLRNGVINFSIYRGGRFMRLETMRIRKPKLFPPKDIDSEEGKRNIDPNFENKKRS